MENHSPITAETYLFSVKEFVSYLEGESIPLESADSQTVLYYSAWRKTKGLSELTVAKDFTALREFGSLLVRKGVWQKNHVEDLERPKVSRALPKVISSVYSKSPPTGIPCAILVTLTPSGFINLDK